MSSVVRVSQSRPARVVYDVRVPTSWSMALGCPLNRFESCTRLINEHQSEAKRKPAASQSRRQEVSAECLLDAAPDACAGADTGRAEGRTPESGAIPRDRRRDPDGKASGPVSSSSPRERGGSSRRPSGLCGRPIERDEGQTWSVI